LTPPTTAPPPKTVRIHRVQAEFRRSGALYRGFVGGIGSGKTWVGCYDMIRRAKRGRTYLVGSPTSVMMGDNTFPKFRAIAESLGVWESCKLTPYPTAALTTGAAVRFRSAEDPEKFRGPDLSGVFLDEASLMPQLAYDISIGRLREGGEQGWLSAAFTPKGPTHWTHDVFNTGRPGVAVFKARTDANPFNSPDYYANLRIQYGETSWARQELGGEFVQIEGAEFPAEWFERPGFWFEDWPECVLKVVYLDPSKGRDAKGGDWQALCSAGLVREPTATPGTHDLRVYLDCQFHREPVPDMVARAIRTCREWGPVTSLCLEDNGTMGFIGPEVERQTRAAGVLLPWELVTNTEPKLFRIRGLGGYLSRGQIRVRNTPGGRLLRAQLGDVPMGQFDDGPDAAAGAVRRLEQLTCGG